MESGAPDGSLRGCPPSAGRPARAVVVVEVRASGASWHGRVLGWLLHAAVVAATVWFWATAVLLLARIVDDRVEVDGVTSPASLLARYYLLLALFCVMVAAGVAMRPDGSVAGRDLVFFGAVGPLVIALGPAALFYPVAVAWVVGPLACAWTLRAVVRRVVRARSGSVDDGRAVASRSGQVT